MRITWVTRSFLDYRLPVFAALDKLCGQELTLVYNRDVVPTRCQERAQAFLGERNIALSGEKRLTGNQVAPISTTRRKGIRIPLQPGLLKACRESRPEVLVTDGFFQWTYAALWLRLRHRIPHVMCYEPTRHTERNAQWFRTFYRRLASRWIDAICCNGSLCREYCRDVLHIPEAKLSAGQMAADSDALAESCRNVPPAETERFRNTHGLTGKALLFVGRLVELKGLAPFLEAWRDAKPENLSFLCVGEGPLMDGLQEFCRQHHIRAHFTGAVDYRQIGFYYRAADAFVIPTLQDNWSLVVPEAMACGLPVASSIYNGCHPELVHPENGWLFDPLDRLSTMDALRKINAASLEDMRRMGACSRNLVQAFSPENAAAAIWKACQKAKNMESTGK